MRLPERGLEDLPGSALLGVVIVSVEKVSKHRLVCRDVSHLNTVYSLSAGLRQRQARPPVWTALVVLDAPKVTGVESLMTLFRVFPQLILTKFSGIGVIFTVRVCLYLIK